MQSVRKSFLTCGLLFLFSALLCAQEIRVETFRQLDRDLLARTHERLDLNDVPCAVVRVAVRQPESFEFEGNVVGDPVYETGEALVWMASGSRNITLKSNDYGVLRYEFPQKLESYVVYELIVQTERSSVTEQSLLLSYTPKHSRVYIDGLLQSGVDNGFLSTVLSVGPHDYLVECLGYQTERGTLYIIPERPSQITIDLQQAVVKEYGALTVTSNRRRTKVYVNDSLCGYAPLKLTSHPIGDYVIQAKRLNCFPQTREVRLFPDSVSNVAFALQRYRPDVFLLAQYDVMNSHPHMFGLMLGVCRQYGYYLAGNLSTALHFSEEWVGSIRKEYVKHNWSIKAGFMGRINKNLYAYVGSGLMRELESYEALIDLGVIARYRRLAFSLGYTRGIYLNNNYSWGEYNGLSLGVGVCLGRGNTR